MIPLSDDNPVRQSPYVTWGLIAGCVAVFLWQAGLPENALRAAIGSYGMVPARVFDIGGTGKSLAVPAELTLFSSQFLHGGWMHLGGNMLYLYIFGDNVEAAMGRFRFLLFYLLAGAAAALGHGALAPASQIPMIGASGAISGVLGAYLLLYPHAHVRVLFLPLPIPIFKIFTISAVFVLGVWFAIQFVSAAINPVDQGGVAFWAHVAGFAAGIVLLPFFKRRDVPYWQAAPAKEFDGREGRRRSSSGPWQRIGGARDRSERLDDQDPPSGRGPWG